MQTTDYEIAIKDSDFPKPFKNGLEYNASVHGTWNIVHIGLQMPEAIQVYVCAKNCMRGVILTAAEMNASDRFSFVIINEENMISENIDDVTIEGVCDVIEKRKNSGCYPRAIQLFTVCAHHFLGSDYNRIYGTLESRYPDIDFYRCYMDPIMQKKGLTPDQKLRRAMLEKLKVCEPKENTAAILGSDFPLDEHSCLMRFLKENDIDVRQNKTCKTYDDFISMSEAKLFIATYPAAKAGVEKAAKVLGRDFMYMPSNFDLEETENQMRALVEYLGISSELKTDTREIMNNRLKERLISLLNELGKTEIVIDYTVHPRPLGLAKMLLEHGFNVTKIYIDAINPEEEKAYEWIKENRPDIILAATIHVNRRFKKETDRSEKLLAIGQKAAYFEDTPHFVNMVAGFGLYGIDGMIAMAELMEEAFLNEKDTRDIVPRKGLGCESCV